MQAGAGFGWHPHAGLATLTYELNFDVADEDTAGQRGIVEATGLEWIRAGGGTWHRGVIHPREEPVTSFQRWVALPPGVEDGPSEAIYVPPAQVPQVGSVCVLLGEFGGQRNPITAPSSIAYLDVTLDAGQAWTWAPPPGHDVAWAFPYRGRVRAGGEAIAGELVVLEEGAAPISLEADEPFRVLSGSAAKQPHRLVLGDYSVHTSRKVLARGEPRIRAVREELRQRGLV